MGFGNKNVPTNRMSMAGKGSSGNGWVNPGKSSTRISAESESEGGALALYAMGGLVAFSVTAGFLFFEDIPVHTYGPEKIFVNQMGGTNYHRHKKRFSVVMPTEESVTDDTQFKLAEACLKGPLRSEKELNNIHTMHIHAEVKVAEEYLECAMRTNVERFCLAAERQLLITQLSTFFQMRAGAFGIEAMFEKLQDGSAAGRANMMMFKTMAMTQEEDPKRYKIGDKLPKALGSDLSQKIRALSKSGYLTRWDFHWTGLSMPELVAPLMVKSPGTPECRKEA